jgi:Protein ChrB, N-terminal
MRWLLLSSRVPREPSRLRLATWRRLRRLGAVLLHEAVWILPAQDSTREALEWLAEEIVEQGGTALLWEAESLAASQDKEVVDRFRAEADERYLALAGAAGETLRQASRRSLKGHASLTQPLRKLRVLERTLRLERRRDWFRAPSWSTAETAIRDAIQRLEALRERSVKGEGHALDH